MSVEPPRDSEPSAPAGAKTCWDEVVAIIVVALAFCLASVALH